MGNNTFGALKGKLTRHYNEWLDFYREEEDRKKREEIESNKDKWYDIADWLNKNDINYTEWFESSVIPDFIHWRGSEFEEVFRVMLDRKEHIQKTLESK